MPTEGETFKQKKNNLVAHRVSGVLYGTGGHWRGLRELLFTSKHAEVTSEAAHRHRKGLTSQHSPPPTHTKQQLQVLKDVGVSTWAQGLCAADLTLHAHINLYSHLWRCELQACAKN